MITLGEYKTWAGNTVEIIKQVERDGFFSPAFLGLINCEGEEFSWRAVYYDNEGNILEPGKPGVVIFCGDCISLKDKLDRVRNSG